MAFEPAPVTTTRSAEPRWPVTCASCGCRLQRVEDLNGYVHFSPRAGRDAAGCIVACADKLHDARGKSL